MAIGDNSSRKGVLYVRMLVEPLIPMHGNLLVSWYMEIHVSSEIEELK
jgi:hypothetical protein